MAKEVIKVKVDKLGNLEIETIGFKGKSCTEATADLEVFLGNAGKTEFTADFYKKDDGGKKTFISNN